VDDDDDESSREEYLKVIFSLISHSFDLKVELKYDTIT
jgi:hypothetical protein